MIPDLLQRHPLPWRLSDDLDFVLDANGVIVLGVADELTGQVIVQSVNSFEEDDDDAAHP